VSFAAKSHSQQSLIAALEDLFPSTAYQNSAAQHFAAMAFCVLRSLSMSPPSIHAYRPHIDGLRAIAVMSVVFYHAGLFIPGGFVGVDVFFVISGFLIIGQIVEAQRHGTFSLKSFWARRALRILPPYVLVITASMVIAHYVLIGNDEIQEFYRQVKYSGMLIANYLFYRQEGYFNGAAELKPLLHLWSLAVEEQFYLAAPLVLAAFAALSKRWAIGQALAITLFVLSFAGCIYFTGQDDEKNPAFFLMPLRAWEFMAGGAIGAALPYLRRLSAHTLDGIGLAALIGLGVSLMVLNNTTPFPSFYAALPVFSAALLIATSECRPTNLVARLLSRPPLVAIGLVSYSWYLWHWPLMAFARIYNFGELPTSWALVAAFVSLVLAALTYVLVERPIKTLRRTAKLDQTWMPVWVGLAACAVFIVAGMTPSLKNAGKKVVWPSGPCELIAAETIEPCLALAKGRPIGVLVGDSHARPHATTLQAHAASAGYQLATITSGGCIGLFDVRKFINGRSKGKKCSLGLGNGLKLLHDGLKPEFAVIANRWTKYVDPQEQTGDVIELGWTSEDSPAANQREFFLSALKRTVSELRAAGVRRILVLGPVPEFQADPSSCVVRATTYGVDVVKRCGQPKSDVERLTARSSAPLKQAIGTSEDIQLIDMVAPLCDETTCRPFQQDGEVLYGDTNHLNERGAKRTATWHAQAFEWLMPTRPMLQAP
jgi:peptidoglycan/LPS O-acetylase OafA/YrhL